MLFQNRTEGASNAHSKRLRTQQHKENHAMNRQEIAKVGRTEPDIMFLESLALSQEPARRRLEVYKEARQLRRKVRWLDEEPSKFRRAPQ